MRILTRTQSLSSTRRRTRGLLPIAAVAVSCLLAATAVAAPLAPSGILFPVPAGLVPGGVVVGAPIVSNVSPATFHGRLTSEVLAGDPTNPLGGLTFVYLIENTSPFPGEIERLTVNSFGGFATDVVYAGLGGPGILPPTYSDRSVGTGDTVGFSFVRAPIGPGTLQPGDSSFLLVVYTNAEKFAPTLASVIDGSVAQAPSYAPTTVIPEPASVMLAVIGGLSLVMCWRRRQRTV